MCQADAAACYLLGSMSRDDDDGFVPAGEERTFLLGALAELVAAGGPGPLVAAPLVEPTPEFFPDRWVGGEASVRRLLRRLLRYAGIEGVEVALTVYGAEDERPREGRPAGSLAGVSDLWLAGMSGSTARFGVEAPLLADPIAVAAAGARAVAHVFRLRHRLPAANPVDEQRRIDVATVYLGFGVLTADAALRYVSRGGRSAQTRLGVLGPQALCFLLAARLVAGGASSKSMRRVAGALQANQGAFLRRSAEILGATPALGQTLGLPERSSWPAPRPLAELTGPLAEGDEEAAAEEAAPAEERGIVGQNAGKPVFRVERRAGGRIARVLVTGTLVLGGMATRPQMGEALTMAQVAMAAVVLGALGWGLGSLFRESRCSEPKCGATLPKDATTCPRCGGTIMGTIRNPRERLAAEEALRRAPDDA